jgi:hypothetical protein
MVLGRLFRSKLAVRADRSLLTSFARQAITAGLAGIAMFLTTEAFTMSSRVSTLAALVCASGVGVAVYLGTSVMGGASEPARLHALVRSFRGER